MMRYLSIGSMLRWATILGMLSCSDPMPESSIPSVPVLFVANLHAAQYQGLEVPGGVVMVERASSANESVGYRGLVLVRSLTETQFYAFDKACPQEGSEGVPLSLVEMELSCPRCGSRFDILSGLGVPIAGPSRLYLRSYPTSYDPASNTLRVSSTR